MATSTSATIATQISALREQLKVQVPAPLLAAFDAQADALADRSWAANIPSVGTPAPDFTLDDSQGQPTSLRDLLVDGAIALFFYRGAWCPYCNVQLSAYAAAAEEFSRLGARLVAISPQRPETSEDLRQAAGLPFPVLSDPGAQVAGRYGLAFEVSEEDRKPFAAAGIEVASTNADGSWWLATPGTFVIDREGVVRLARAEGDFRHRTEVETLLEALDEPTPR